MTEKSKDTFINFKAIKKGTTKTGKDSLQLSLAQDQAVALIEELRKVIDNQRGVKLSVYTGKKETKDGSRTFDSGFAVVTAIQEFGANALKQYTAVKTSTISPDVAEKIKKLKAQG